MILLYWSLLCLELKCGGALSSQHINKNTICSVAPQILELDVSCYLETCGTLSSSSLHSWRLSFGWKPALSANRHKQKQHGLLLKLHSWSFLSLKTFLWSTCTALPTQLGTLKFKKHHWSMHSCFHTDVTPLYQQPSPLILSPGNSVACSYLPTGLWHTWELFTCHPLTSNNVCPPVLLRALNSFLALVKAPQYHQIEAHRHSTNRSAGPISVGLKGRKNGVHQNNRLPRLLV